MLYYFTTYGAESASHLGSTRIVRNLHTTSNTPQHHAGRLLTLGWFTSSRQAIREFSYLLSPSISATLKTTIDFLDLNRIYATEARTHRIQTVACCPPPSPLRSRYFPRFRRGFITPRGPYVAETLPCRRVRHPLLHQPTPLKAGHPISSLGQARKRPKSRSDGLLRRMRSFSGSGVTVRHGMPFRKRSRSTIRSEAPTRADSTTKIILKGVVFGMKSVGMRLPSRMRGKFCFKRQRYAYPSFSALGDACVR